MSDSGAPPAGAPMGGPMPKIPSPFTTTLVAVTVTFLGLATIALGLRIWCARKSSRNNWLTMDLMLIIAALIVTYGCIITSIVGAATLGLDYMNMKMSTEKSAQFLFKIYFSDVITTTIASGLVKISILEFYKRLFGIRKSFTITCDVMIFLVSSWMIGTFFTQLFSTNPISSAWHPERQLVDANYDYPTALLAIFGIGIVLDFLVLCLPLRPIWQLQLSLANKIKVSLILWLGAFCVVAASVRFYYAYRQLHVVFTATAQEKGTITVLSSLWSKIEPSASIVAACLPTYGPLFSNRGLGSMIRSTFSFLSISSRSHGSAGSSKNANHSENLNDKNGKWHELSPSQKTDIETSSTQSLTRPENGFIRATSEIRTTHQMSHLPISNHGGRF